MPRGRKPVGEKALTNAERQGRHRASRATAPVKVITRPRRPTDRRSRLQRWQDAVKELVDLQATYADWLATLPESLRDSRTAEALKSIADLDRNVSTTLIQPGLEFRLGVVALVERLWTSQDGLAVCVRLAG